MNNEDKLQNYFMALMDLCRLELGILDEISPEKLALLCGRRNDKLVKDYLSKKYGIRKL